MELYTLARVVHVLAVVFWIGGVAMVTTVLIPFIKQLRTKEERLETFERIESKFAMQAKIATVLTALSGFFMLYYLDAWERYLYWEYWWLHAMTFVWFLFTLVLFVLEPLFLHRIFKKYAIEKPEKTFNFLQKAHWFLLILSLITIMGAVAGSHGFLFF